MDRRTTGALTLSCILAAACGGGQLGLANAPALGAAPSGETRVHDVIANAGDGCDSMGESPLRGHTPPCPASPESPAVRGLSWGNRMAPSPHRDLSCASWLAYDAMQVETMAVVPAAMCVGTSCRTAALGCLH